MKTVYTITFHKANNYGAMLQAYALQKVLSQNYNTKILNYDNKFISNGYKLFQKGNRGIKNKCVQLIKDFVNLKKNYVRSKNFDKFRKKFLLTDYYSNSDEVANNYPSADAYITGSDQVWNPKITDGLDSVYTLNFGNNDFKKISYAASSGDNDSITKYEDELINSLKKFDNISVREASLQKLLTTKLPTGVSLVLDPTLLIKKEEWEELATDKRLIKEKYIFVYCGDEPDYFYNTVNELSKRTGYLIVHFGRRDLKNKFKGRKKSCYEAGPQEFVNLVKNAEYVVTVSFHATAFAVMLNRKMFIILNRFPDRLKTLLNLLELSDRIISNDNDFEKVYTNKIDWNKTNTLLSNERNKSINWLLDSIEHK